MIWLYPLKIQFVVEELIPHIGVTTSSNLRYSLCANFTTFMDVVAQKEPLQYCFFCCCCFPFELFFVSVPNIQTSCTKGLARVLTSQWRYQISQRRSPPALGSDLWEPDSICPWLFGSCTKVIMLRNAARLIWDNTQCFHNGNASVSLSLFDFTIIS